ncbi:hypothetical protein ACKI2N_012440 [Cupriavidus sp. 30B13]|uniref:hypothetical protein n=1 Tax=Cupriavidus sp. 30B13 TaxID=3384241 RepID=UPI003B8F6AF7
MHYHGTPIGGTRQDVARFLMGRHALVPYPRQDDMGVVAEVCQSFVLDNGAFSIWRKGGTLDVEGYTAWVRQWYRHPGFDWALIPDVIGGTEGENDALLDAWPADLVPHGVPVWHLHESTDRLARLAQGWRVVALGSSGEWATPGTRAWWVRMREAINAICDDQGRPLCKLHGLRMLNPDVFSKLPLSSADSTNAGRNCNQLDRYGIYVPPTAAQRAAIIADRVERFSSAGHFERTDEEWACYFAS